ncbi:uracil-DNA glycosylase [Arthrobacter livingstonensis]|uniref:Uracil-DNA glycosylase n=1 Tax=Arthrobacter livingstonensis TaxID=670078 RepID=A0A2V5LDJ0_9MICC|nr:uracil-DNA glycosylase [Arthrobacter livingstonensis]PYI68952.1 uracil-DNA glycosylase [Arthrobacter livingstonensis]
MDSSRGLFDLPSPAAWDAAQLHALDVLGEDPLSLLAADWADALAVQAPTLRRLGRMLRREYDAGTSFLPPPTRVLRALAAPLSGVRVLIVGQDPYPTPGHSVGLAFAVDRATRPLPRSLNNIYKERQQDLGIAPAAHGDLSAWADQGVLLLNRVLTVAPGAAGSHRRRGWEGVTEAVIRTLAVRGQPLVSVLWGRDAQKLGPLLAGTAVIESAHPSPLSASRGFFGSRPFSRINASLEAQGSRAIDWDLPA